MTAVYERMVDVFEKYPEIFGHYKIELLRGDIVMMAGPDRVHNINVLLIERQIPLDRWYPLQTQDIALPGEESEPQPDLVVIEQGAFEGPGRLVDGPAAALLVEVVSKNSGHYDYEIKRRIYAAGRVPAYLIVDPFAAQCVLLTEPVGAGDEADYSVQRTTKFGDPVPLDMLGVTLDTSALLTLPGKPR
ncbi:Uma2 family endonuclease [Streptomyces sp. LX-29]|uniref:Uma2 family endonuclease n=1 Tax=Streptomyces sp. LX-29 TaxID=2900152 RepID=UPI00240DD117|nr:Uma2 family endonuclease [Streptomyces sp. LX-29]WFB09648.1 Uma2 family endonuclease [Streptomyces sp. LX-29]